MSGLVGREIRTQFVVITLLQDFRHKITRASEALHVIAITVDIPLQLGERQIVDLKGG